jgi:zinc protease
MSKLTAFLTVLVFSSLINVSGPVLANSSIKEKIKHFDWDGLEVVWLEDNRFPTFDMAIYFADGALSDKRGEDGLTNAMFNLLPMGTRRFGRQEISDNLEFYGVSHGAYVTHEYSTYNVSGLLKDMNPTVKKICHLFEDAIYPKKEIAKEKKRFIDSRKNLANNHGQLINTAFRALSLKGTPYEKAVGGTIKSIRKVNQKNLKKKLDYFNKVVKKKIYITGPKEVLSLKKTILDDCNWKKTPGQFVRSVDVSSVKSPKPQIYLVTVPKANQAKISMGRYLPENLVDSRESELMALSSEFLGGGFTSMLMKELRVKRGLTYGAYAFAGGQKQYGRSGISTSTKADSVGELLKVTQEVIENIINSNYDKKDLEVVRGGLKGSHPFKFEKNSSFLSQLLFLDHIEEDYETIYQFPAKVSRIKSGDVEKKIHELYGVKTSTIVVVGEKSLAKALSKFGKIQVIPYKKFL